MGELLLLFICCHCLWIQAPLCVSACYIGWCWVFCLIAAPYVLSTGIINKLATGIQQDFVLDSASQHNVTGTQQLVPLHLMSPLIIVKRFSASTWDTLVHELFHCSSPFVTARVRYHEFPTQIKRKRANILWS